MIGSLQKGIYHFHEPHIGNSFCVIFLRASGNTSAQEFGEILAKIWVKLQDLEKGIVSDLDVNPKKKIFRKPFCYDGLWTQSFPNGWIFKK